MFRVLYLMEKKFLQFLLLELRIFQSHQDFLEENQDRLLYQNQVWNVGQFPPN